MKLRLLAFIDCLREKIAFLAFFSCLLLSLKCFSQYDDKKTESLKISKFTLDLKGSVDWAKTIEKGNSSITYNSKTRENVLIYTPLNLGPPNPFHFTDPRTPNDNAFDNSSFDEHRLNHEPANKEDRYQKSNPEGRFSTFVLGIGIGWVGKGAKFKDVDGGFTLDYLEIPIHLTYYKPAGLGYIYGGLGPYFAYGIGGKYGDVKSFSEDGGGYKKFDAGISFILGYRMLNGFIVDVGYDLGLANITYSSTDVTSHNRCFDVHIGYEISRLFMKGK